MVTVWRIMNIFERLPDEKREKVILFSMKEFAEYGYELASTNRIVANLRISKGSLFKYFNSKLSLYMYLVKYATSDLVSYLDKNLQLESKNDWREYLLNYVSVEYDYLILKPLMYHFFRKVVKEINQNALSNINDELLKLTNSYMSSIRKDLKINDYLLRHLFFIIKGYNENYLENTNQSDINENTKKDYIAGLNKHFDYVKE